MGERPKVIVADSSDIFRMYFSTVLNRMNFEALPVEQAADVLPLARIVAPDMITLAARFDSVDGIRLLRELRADPQLGMTPVIVLSDDAADEQPARDAGSCSFLSKPVNLRQLHLALQHCWSNNIRRYNLRAPLNRRVSYRANGASYESMAVTLSEGGIYLRMEQPLAVGERVEVELALSKREMLLLAGEVIYTKERHSGVFAGVPGAAIRFDNLELSVQSQLSEEVARLLAGDIVEAQTEQVLQID